MVLRIRTSSSLSCRSVDFIVIDYGLLHKSQPISCLSYFFASNPHLMNEITLAFCPMSFFYVCANGCCRSQQLAANLYRIQCARKSLN